jgi:Uma2 family endonuclease
MSALRLQPFVTPEEYLALERAADFKSEYFSGEMVAMSGASHRHETIAVNLTAEIRNALRGKPCKPKGSNLRVRVRRTNYLYPDLTVICGEPQFADNEYLDTLLNPTAIFEILSESTESKDRGFKWRLYQQIPSLEQYVLIYQDTARIEVYTRHRDVDWLVHTEAGLTATIDLSAIGVTLALSDLYEDVVLEPGIDDP